MIGHVVDAATPAVIVQWGTWWQQACVTARLDRLAEGARAKGIGAPAVVVIGRAATIDSALDRRADQPLRGKTVLVTRARVQASDLSRRLRVAGARVIEAPMYELAAPDSFDACDEALRSLGVGDTLAVTSPYAVEILQQRLAAIGRDSRHLAGVRLASLGAVTSAALRRIGLEADLEPAIAQSQALGDRLIEKGPSVSADTVITRRVLLWRADVACPGLPERLAEAGYDVLDPPAYRTVPAEVLPDEARAALAADPIGIDWITFTSSTAVKRLVDLAGREAIRPIRAASIGPMTSAAMAEQGLTVSVEATTTSVQALAEAIIAQSLTDAAT